MKAVIVILWLIEEHWKIIILEVRSYHLLWILHSSQLVSIKVHIFRVHSKSSLFFVSMLVWFCHKVGWLLFTAHPSWPLPPQESKYFGSYILQVLNKVIYLLVRIYLPSVSYRNWSIQLFSLSQIINILSSYLSSSLQIHVIL